jgi:hypothetical protein
MAYWIFKLSRQELYPDVPGQKYIYDNTHSVRVRGGDVFLFLDKRKKYSFTATGCVADIRERAPTPTEAARTANVRTVFEAHLSELIYFTPPLSISPLIDEGRANRAKLGIEDVNLLGWSQSIPRLNEAMYDSIMDLAQQKRIIPNIAPVNPDFSVPDSWGKVRVRKALGTFVNTVLSRHGNRCGVCGTGLAEVLDAAHLSPYCTDVKNRANPSNGICLCSFCHRALDQRLIAIEADGTVLVASEINDEIARAHFSSVPATIRRGWIEGIDPEFLALTVVWFKQARV